MRILMLDNEYPPLGGGMGTANAALLQELSCFDAIEVDLITSALGLRKEEQQLFRRFHSYKVPVRNRNLHHSSNRELLAYSAMALPLALQLHRTRPFDICFAWSTLPAGFVASALKRLRGLDYLVWVSGPDIPGFERRYKNLYPFLKPTIRLVWRGASQVIAKCADEARVIRGTDPSISPEIIANGVDLELFHPGVHRPDDGPLSVICSARLIERKGQHHLIQAVRLLKDDGVNVELFLVGTGDSERAYQVLVQEMGVSDRVHFLGYVPREEIAKYYMTAHAFALASFSEGMSLATLEAMACGLPIVVTKSGTSELVEEGVNGFTFDWGDVATLARHLKTLALNRELARRLGLASRKRAENFGWPSITARYLDLFRRVLEPTREAELRVDARR